MKLRPADYKVVTRDTPAEALRVGEGCQEGTRENAVGGAGTGVRSTGSNS